MLIRKEFSGDWICSSCKRREALAQQLLINLCLSSPTGISFNEDSSFKGNIVPLPEYQ